MHIMNLGPQERGRHPPLYIGIEPHPKAEKFLAPSHSRKVPSSHF